MTSDYPPARRDSRGARGATSAARAGALALPLVERDRGEDEGADDDLQVEGVDRQQVAAVVEGADDQGARGCAEGAAFCPEQGRAADDAGGDGVELVAGTGGWDAGV